jgi:hypothetical protein
MSDKKELEVNIDFDGASKAWMRNKKKMKGGYYKYCCGHKRTNGKYCRKNPWYWKRAISCYNWETSGWGLCTHHKRIDKTRKDYIQR